MFYYCAMLVSKNKNKILFVKGATLIKKDKLKTAGQHGQKCECEIWEEGGQNVRQINFLLE